MPKKKKTATSGELVMVKSVHRTRSRRMKFCVHGGLGDSLNKQRRKPNGQSNFPAHMSHFRLF